MYKFLVKKYKVHISNESFSEILIGSALALVSKVVVTALGLASTIMVTRFFGTDAMGVLAIINSYIFLLSIFTLFGSNTSILRLIPEHVTKHSVSSAFFLYKKIRCIVVVVSLLAGIVCFIASDLLADKILMKSHLSSIFSVASIFVVFKSLMDLNIGALRGLRLIRMFAIMQAIPSVCMVAFLSIGILMVKEENCPVYAQFAAHLVAAVFGIWLMNRSFREKIKSDGIVQSMTVKDILAISIPMMMTASLSFLSAQAGVIMLGIFSTETEVGYYAIAVKLATLTLFIQGAINTMAAPKFSELYHVGNLEELFNVAKKSTKLIFWTTVPILLFILLMGRPIIESAFGVDYMKIFPAMLLLIIGQFVNAISGSTGYFMNMTGLQSIYRNIIACAAAINVVLNFALIPNFGIEGAAVAAAVSLCFWNICTLICIRMKFGVTIGYLPFVM